MKNFFQEIKFLKVVIKFLFELIEGIKPEMSGRSLPGEDLKLRFWILINTPGGSRIRKIVS